MSVSRLYVAVSLATIERQAGRYNVGLADYTSSAGSQVPDVVAKQSIFFCSFLNTMHSSSRIIGYDYIRAISILLVIFFHFSSSFDIYSITGFHNIFYSVGYTGWGSVAVYMFLMLSGASLYLNYSDTLNVKNFYKKRWLSIYPQFYIAWITLYFVQSFLKDTFLWGGQYYKILLSLLGVDGYFFYLGQNYYIIGEWFLGAIVFLYILFPLLRYLLKYHEKVTTILILVCFFGNLATDYFEISDYRNICTCLLSFWAGMLFEKYRKHIEHNIYSFLISVVLCCIIIHVKFNLIIYTVLLSILFFMIIFFIPRVLPLPKYVYAIINNVCRYSYSLFLVHHVVIRFVMKRFENDVLSLTYVFLMLFFVLFITYILSAFLHAAGRYIVRVYDFLQTNIQRYKLLQLFILFHISYYGHICYGV